MILNAVRYLWGNKTNNESTYSSHYKGRFLWPSTKEQGLGHRKPCNNMDDEYNNVLYLESRVEHNSEWLESVVFCLRFVVFRVQNWLVST